MPALPGVNTGGRGPEAAVPGPPAAAAGGAGQFRNPCQSLAAQHGVHHREVDVTKLGDKRGGVRVLLVRRPTRLHVLPYPTA